MKRVVLLTDGWKRLVTYSWNIGIKEAIASYDEDVIVFQFNSFGNWSDSDSFNFGEYNIFNFPQLSKFDGILLDATNVTDEKVLDTIINKILETKVPAVSLGKRIEGLYYVGIDNISTITELMNHLYNQHDCRSFVYAGGPKDNCDNIERQQAYENYMKEKKLSLVDNPVWQGFYTFDQGVEYFHEMMDKGMPIPDAFVCGNDHIATGIIVGAKEYGYEVPRDFLVTGFDNLEQSRFFKPHLTTVEQKREKIGSAGMEILFKIWNNQQLDNQILVDNVCIYSQSCGCETEDNVDYPHYVEHLLATKSHKTELEGQLANYQINLSVAQSYEAIFNALTDYVIEQNCQDFALMLDTRLLLGYGMEVFPTEGYDYDNMIIPIFVEKGKIKEISDISFFKKEIIDKSLKGVFVFSPIHYENRALGVVLIKDGDFLFDNPGYCNMLMYLSQALIRIYQSNALASENEKLDYLYKHDQLTGVYNRIAFRMDSEKYIAHLHQHNSECVLAFVDADKFKQINDTYGHDRGDEVLIEIARTLGKNSSNGVVYRYGGDEFIVLLDNANDIISSYIDRVTSDLRRHDISVSIGYIISKPGDEIDIDRYVNEADSIMYEVKRAK